MGVSVYATLFVGCKESELPESALNKLARLPVFEEYEDEAAELFEDNSLVPWLDDYAKPIPELAFPLIATEVGILDEGEVMLVGFEIASTSRTVEFTEEETTKMEQAKREFQEFFGFPAKVYLFAEWS